MKSLQDEIKLYLPLMNIKEIATIKNLPCGWPLKVYFMAVLRLLTKTKRNPEHRTRRYYNILLDPLFAHTIQPKYASKYFIVKVFYYQTSCLL